MAGNFFRGTSVEQDGRFGKSDERLMAKMSKAGKFSPILDTKVNMKKVNIDFMSKWITAKIIQVVGFEDDIVINLIVNLLEGDVLDPKKMQLDVTGFLEKQAQSFVEELWTLLVDAQTQPSGIPSIFIQQKKEEIINREQLKVNTTKSHTTTNAAQSSLESDDVKPVVDHSKRGDSRSRRADATTDRHGSGRSGRRRDSEREDRERSPSRQHRRRDSSRSRDRGSRGGARDERSGRRDDSRNRDRRDRGGRDFDDSRDSSRYRPRSSSSGQQHRHHISSRRDGGRDSSSSRPREDRRRSHHREEERGPDSSRHSRSSRRSRSHSGQGDATAVAEGGAVVVSDVEQGDNQRRPRADSSSSSEGDHRGDDHDSVVPL